MEASAAAMDVRLDRLERNHQTLEQRHQTFEQRQAAIQRDLASITELSRASAMSLTKLEHMLNTEHGEMRDQLIAALRAAPQTNKAGSTLGMVLAALAMLLVIVLVMNGSLG